MRFAAGVFTTGLQVIGDIFRTDPDRSASVADAVATELSRIDQLIDERRTDTKTAFDLFQSQEFRGTASYVMGDWAG